MEGGSCGVGDVGCRRSRFRSFDFLDFHCSVVIDQNTVVVFLSIVRF
jgi:hypothetical protein